MSVYKLRLHHLLCIGFFEGKGYDDGFTANMARVVGLLAEDGSEVELTRSADLICAACPNDLNGCCTSTDKVRRYDSAVMDLCGLREGEVYTARELFDKTRERIILSGRLGEVCGDCCWADICRGKTYNA